MRLRRKARRVMRDDKAKKTVPPRRSFVEFGMRGFLEGWSASACDVGGAWPLVPAIVDTSGGGSGGDDDDGPGIYDVKQTDDVYFLFTSVSSSSSPCSSGDCGCGIYVSKCPGSIESLNFEREFQESYQLTRSRLAQRWAWNLIAEVSQTGNFQLPTLNRASNTIVDV